MTFDIDEYIAKCRTMIADELRSHPGTKGFVICDKPPRGLSTKTFLITLGDQKYGISVQLGLHNAQLTRCIGDLVHALALRRQERTNMITEKDIRDGFKTDPTGRGVILGLAIGLASTDAEQYVDALRFLAEVVGEKLERLQELEKEYRGGLVPSAHD